MILILASNTNQHSAEYQQLTSFLAGLEGISTRVHPDRNIFDRQHQGAGCQGYAGIALC